MNPTELPKVKKEYEHDKNEHHAHSLKAIENSIMAYRVQSNEDAINMAN